MKMNGVLFVYQEKGRGLTISEPCRCLICGVIVFKDDLLYDVYGIHQFAKRTGVLIGEEEYLISCDVHRKELQVEAVCPRL